MFSLSYMIQILLYLSIIYYFFSIKASYENQYRMNIFLLVTVLALSVFALKGAYIEHLLGTIIGLMIFGTGMWFYIQKIRKDQFIMNDPMGYLSFYFIILFIVLTTGQSQSLLFPEVFLLAVLFGVTNAGRKISFAISLMSATTIVLFYLHDPVFTGMIYRLGITIALLLLIPQIAGKIYNKKAEQARSVFLNSEESNS